MNQPVILHKEKKSGLEKMSPQKQCIRAGSQGLSHNKQQQYSMDVCSGLAGLHPGARADSESSIVPDCTHAEGMLLFLQCCILH